MNRDELIKGLKDAVAMEKAAALCVRNIISTMAWSGLEEEERDEAEKGLKGLAEAPDRRAEALEKMIAQVTGGSTDVF